MMMLRSAYTDLCNYEDEFVLNSSVPWIFLVFGIIIVIMQVITQDYYKSQLEIIALTEKMEELDLELGLLRSDAVLRQTKSN